MEKEISDLDRQILGVLFELEKEHELAKRQGFPSRRRDYYSQYSRKHDSIISGQKYNRIAYYLGIDYNQFKSILEIIKHEGMLEDYKFINPAM